jgi:L-asparaginase II
VIGTSYRPVYELTRGRIVESVHYGAAAVVDSGGRLLAFWGDPGLTTFMRSSAKPFQALPFVEEGGPEHFGLSSKEIALICASHSGTDDHDATARRIQAAAGFGEADLQCGVHLPFDSRTRRRLEARGQPPGRNRHNCSGKHSGMLAYARMKAWPLDSYLAENHPVQERITAALLDMTCTPPGALETGTDGCSAPNFALPLYNAALGFARLADPEVLEPVRAKACRTITDAMLAHPDMVAGPGVFDTRLMKAAGGRLVAKGGAEGYQGVGIFPSDRNSGSLGIGVAVKIADGAARPGLRSAVVLEVLRQLEALPLASLAQLEDIGPQTPLYNFENRQVGEGRPCFQLRFYGRSGAIGRSQ